MEEKVLVGSFDLGRGYMGRERCNASILLTDPSRDGAVLGQELRQVAPLFSSSLTTERQQLPWWLSSTVWFWKSFLEYRLKTVSSAILAILWAS